MAEPPSLIGALKETVSVWSAGTMPDEPVVMVGAPGVVYGVPDTTLEVPPLPTALTARTATLYAVPLASAVDPSTDDAAMSHDSVEPAPWHGMPAELSEYHVLPPSVDQS